MWPELLTRREWLSIGGAGLGGLTLPQLLAADESRQTSRSKVRVDSCILIFLNGGPSHLDMWDMKPNAPTEIRGEFRPISSSLSGVPVCELLPRMARQMHKVTVVRSMQHSVNNSHAAAVYAAMTGHDRGEQGGGAKRTDYPSPGSVISKLLPDDQTSVPYVALPYKTQEGAGGPLQPGFLAGFMGQSYDPFWVLRDPSQPDFHVPNLQPCKRIPSQRLSKRRELLSTLSETRVDPLLEQMDRFQCRAFDLLQSTQVQRAFNIENESDKLRESYGKNIYGQSVLLSRRLIEAGTRLVTISWAPDANATWDTHGNNFKKLRNSLLPQFDAAFSSLMDDLEDRGMLDRTLVAVLGDFGRTPRINKSAGRDHWNSCYTIMLAGAGIRQGFVYGASDRIGATPTSNPTSPGDIVTTLYHLFGLDGGTYIYDPLGRPHPLINRGTVVSDLLT